LERCKKAVVTEREKKKLRSRKKARFKRGAGHKRFPFGAILGKKKDDPRQKTWKEGKRPQEEKGQLNSVKDEVLADQRGNLLARRRGEREKTYKDQRNGR